MDRLAPDQFVAAHRTAFAMLDGDAARAQIAEEANEALLRARVHHAGLGRDPSAVSTTAQQLMGYYREHRRASALLDVFGQANFRTIGEVWKVSAGWAHLATGSRGQGEETLLEDVHDDELEPVEEADRLALIAEAEEFVGRRRAPRRSAPTSSSRMHCR